jgi:hypothetical protein
MCCIVKTVEFDIPSHYCVTATFVVQGSLPAFPYLLGAQAESVNILGIPV